MQPRFRQRFGVVFLILSGLIVLSPERATAQGCVDPEISAADHLLGRAILDDGAAAAEMSDEEMREGLPSAREWLQRAQRYREAYAAYLRCKGIRDLSSSSAMKYVDDMLAGRRKNFDAFLAATEHRRPATEATRSRSNSSPTDDSPRAVVDRAASTAGSNVTVCVEWSQTCMDPCTTPYCLHQCRDTAMRCINDIQQGRDPGPQFSGRQAAQRTDSRPVGTPRLGPSPRPSTIQTPPPAPQARSAPAQVVDQPYSNSGKPCIQVKSLPQEKSSTTRQNAEACDGNFCWDVIYRFEATNVCSSPMVFQWAFKNSTLPGLNSRTVGPGQSTRVGCEKNLGRCDGNISYGWHTR